MTNGEIPMFEGEPVKKIVLGLTGRSDQADRYNTFRIGDEVTVLVSGTVTKVTHAERDDGMERVHTVKVAEAHVLEDGEAGELLANARAQDRRILDEMLGRAPLWDDDGNPQP